MVFLSVSFQLLGDTKNYIAKHLKKLASSFKFYKFSYYQCVKEIQLGHQFGIKVLYRIVQYEFIKGILRDVRGKCKPLDPKLLFCISSFLQFNIFVIFSVKLLLKHADRLSELFLKYKYVQKLQKPTAPILQTMQ